MFANSLLFRALRFAFLIGMGLALGGRVATAQTQTFTYQGPAFDPARCTPSDDVTCQGGNIIGSVTFLGVPYDIAEIVPSADVVDLSLTAQGYGFSVSLSDTVSSDNFELDYGKLANWSVTLARFSTDLKQASTSSNGGSGTDAAVIQTLTAPEHTTEGQTSIAGFWTNTKSLGKPCCRAGGAVASAY